MCLAFLPKLPIAYYATSFQTVARVTEAVKARPGLLEALETTVLPKKSPLPGSESAEGRGLF